MVVKPASASTVVLVRDGAVGIEVYLMRRATSMAFAASMHVFPGGRVDPRDYEVDLTFVGPDDEAARLAKRASTDVPEVRALFACAVRETAEETGVWLALVDDSGGIVIDPAVMPLADHWVTPAVEGHRYDVRFFAALLPEGQEARLTTTEADHAQWIAPVEALERSAAGSMALMPPTISMIRYLAGFPDCASLLADAATREVVPLLPVLIVHDDGREEWTMTVDTEGRP